MTRALWLALILVVLAAPALAQDIRGLEVCTAEKAMERRTSCLQSNVDFLHKSMTRLSADHQQKLDAANRQIDALKASIVAMQKVVDDLRAEQAKQAEDLKKKPDAAAAKNAAPPAAKEPGK